jgi:enoyl-CoA hydratase
MSDQAILTEDRDGILIVTINRPDARNSVNGDVASGMAEALDRLDTDDDLRVGIVTGAGGYFSAGMDLKAFVQGQSPYAGDRGFAGITQRSSRKPLIAAVEGFALAGGFEIALSCDLIVASREARFGIPEVKRSLVAAAGASCACPSGSRTTWRWSWRSPASRSGPSVPRSLESSTASRSRARRWTPRSSWRTRS